VKLPLASDVRFQLVPLFSDCLVMVRVTYTLGMKLVPNMVTISPG
jgi:hypothetical protein